MQPVACNVFTAPFCKRQINVVEFKIPTLLLQLFNRPVYVITTDFEVSAASDFAIP